MLPACAHLFSNSLRWIASVWSPVSLLYESSPSFSHKVGMKSYKRSTFVLQFSSAFPHTKRTFSTTSHPNTLDNALLQYPLLFPRCHCLGQRCHGLCNPGAQGRRQRRRPAVTELQHGQLDVLRFLLLFRGLSGIYPKWPAQRLGPRRGRQCPHWVELRCYWLAGMVLYPSTLILFNG